MIYGLIGEHLGHSFSAEIHAYLGKEPYELKELSPEEVEGFLRRGEFRGINVTIPYKQAVIPFLDGISETAREIGAVNTIARRDGKLLGTNTDAWGLRRLLEHIGADLRGKKVLILGTGGTSRTALYTAEQMKAREVLRVSRTAREGAVTYEEAAEKHADAEILINTTPCGMFPRGGDCPVNLDAFPRLEAVADAIYNPLRTRLVTEARKRGIAAEGGLYMLTAQAVQAAAFFRGKDYPPETTEEIYRALTREKENMVLIGMPGSGKSTVAAALARITGRPVADTDREIVNMAGKPIPEIFRDEGEQTFRDLESKVLEEVSARNGQIIATGGGAVLRSANVDTLRQNGRLILLERAAEELTPTADRPLADTREKMEKLRKEREPIYRAAAEMTVLLKRSPEETAREIESRWQM
ncbi:MAG: shikimate dehydrogenase [Clostridia bacterium]|nr:shikimate dehydrogenase [Clostridia bacterium]